MEKRITSSEAYRAAKRAAQAIAVVTTDEAAARAAMWASTTAFFEPAISPGTTAQFWRGDKTWQAIAINDVTGLSASLSGRWRVALLSCRSRSPERSTA